MSTLLLIRHGQASFGSRDYDRLSPLGECQARILGAHFERLGTTFATIHSGRLRRQVCTARIAVETMNGNAPSQVVPDAGFDEYDADGIVKAYAARVLEDDADLARDRTQLFTDRKLFQRAFSGMIEAWLKGELGENADSLEPWPAFKARVHAALERLGNNLARDEVAAVYTSAGVIGVAVQAALGLDDAATAHLTWGIRNASITCLHRGRNGLRLMGFNETTHLALERRPDLLTFR